MVKTHGLTHISLVVADAERALAFYARVFGVAEAERDERSVMARGPGAFDVIAFEQRATGAGVAGGVRHFGFRLVDAADMDRAVAEVEAAGGRLIRRGELAPGCPYAYVADPDGYTIELWCE